MPHQQQKPPVALPGQHGPKGFAACRIKARRNLCHGLAQQSCLLHSICEIPTVQDYFLRLGQQHCMIRRKGHTQGFVMLRQGLQPCFNGRCWHICADFQRQHHEELLPVLWVRAQKMAGKGQQRHAFAGSNWRVVHGLHCRRVLCPTFQLVAKIGKTGLAQKFGGAERGDAVAPQDARNLDCLDGIAAIAEKVAFFRNDTVTAGVQNLTPGIGKHLTGITAGKSLAGTAHALRQLLQQALRIYHAAGVVLQHNARCIACHQRKTCRKFACPQLNT